MRRGVERKERSRVGEWKKEEYGQGEVEADDLKGRRGSKEEQRGEGGKRSQSGCCRPVLFTRAYPRLGAKKGRRGRGDITEFLRARSKYCAKPIEPVVAMPKQRGLGRAEEGGDSIQMEAALLGSGEGGSTPVFNEGMVEPLMDDFEDAVDEWKEHVWYQCFGWACAWLFLSPETWQ